MTDTSRWGYQFVEEATKHQRAAREWLIATALIGAAAIIVLLHSAEALEAATRVAPAALLVQAGAARVLAISVLIAATRWCARNYGLHRHHEIVNRHWHNTLGFFAPKFDDAVMLVAAQRMFAPQPTGFLTPIEVDSTPGPRIDDLIGALATKTEPLVSDVYHRAD